MMGACVCLQKSDELEKTRNDLANQKLQVAFMKQMFDANFLSFFSFNR